MAEPQDEFDALCTGIGYLVITWGLAEQCLDKAIETMFYRYGGVSLEKDPQLPRSLKRKLSFCRKCFALESLSKFRAEGLEILERFDSLSKQRHDVIHSAITSHTPKDGLFNFRKIDYDNLFHVPRIVTLGPGGFLRLLEDLMDLGRDTSALYGKLADNALQRPR